MPCPLPCVSRCRLIDLKEMVQVGSYLTSFPYVELYTAAKIRRMLLLSLQTAPSMLQARFMPLQLTLGR